MKLEDLVQYFRNGGLLETFCQENSLDVEAEVIEIYMQKPFSLGTDLCFFEIEKTGGKVEFVVNDVKYYNLFDLFYFLEVINGLKDGRNKDLSDSEVANILLQYAINDA